MGETPNLAARLQGLAVPNQVIIASATRNLVGGTFALQDRGESSIKGFSSRIRSWAVLHERAVDSRFDAGRDAELAPLVGREEELEILLRR